MARTLLKIVIWVVGIVLGLFLLVWILIQIPGIQNAIVQKLTQSLSKTLDTEVAIKRVNIRFFKTVVLEGIYIESKQNDTLLYAQRLAVNIGILDLFDNRIHVNDISLEGAKVNLYRAETENVYNYQFLLDAFATEPDTAATETVWTFGINEVRIQDSYFRMLDEFARSDIEAKIQDFAVNVGDLDLENRVLDVKLIRLENSQIAYRLLPKKVAAANKPDSAVVIISDTMVAPEQGWSLSLNRLRLQNNTFIYDNQNTKPVANAVDFNHLTLQNFILDANSLAVRGDDIQGNIETLAFRDRSGFELKRLAADLEKNERQISVQNFILETPYTEFRASTTLDYDNFDAFLKDITTNARVNLVIEDSHLAFRDLAYFAPSIQEIKQLNTDLNKNIRLYARAQGTLSNLNNFVANLEIENGVRLRAEGSASNLTNPERLSFNVNLQEVSTSYNNLKRLTRGVAIPAGLKDFGNVKLSGQFTGNLDTISGQNIILQTQSYTGFRGDLRAQSVRNINKLRFNLNIRELRTQAQDLKGFVANGLPPQVKNLGKIRYVGKLSGTTTKFNLDGSLQTDAGTAVTDILLDFNKNYSNASYRGKVDLKNFNIGKVLADTTFGKVTLALNVAGSGLSVDKIKADLQALVTAFDYRGYEYNNFQIDGKFNQQQFIGKANIKDPNITFAFDGNVNLNDSLPVFKFFANVDTVNLQKLNFYKTPLSFSGDITADFIGANLNDLDGSARIADLSISNDTAFYQTDSIVLRSSQPDTTGKLLTLQSDFINAKISGNYNLSDLSKLLQNFVNDYFPVDNFLSPIDQPTELAIEPERSRVYADQDFDILIQFNNPVPLLRLFVGTIEKLDTATFSMHLDSKGRDLNILAVVPQLIMQGRTFSNIQLKGEGTPETLLTSLTMEDIDYGAVRPLSSVQLTASFGNDSLFFDLEAIESNEDSTIIKLALGAGATQVDGTYHLIFDEKFVLNGANWRIPASNEILYRSNFLDINNFELRKDEQGIAINSQDSPQDRDFAPIGIAFENFQIKEIFNLLNMSEDKYAGEVNGTVTLRDLSSNLNYLVDLSINNIALNEEPVGNLIIKAEPAGRQIIKVNVALDGQSSNATIAGNYNLANNGLDLKAEIQSLELHLLDPFAAKFIKDSQGTLRGNFAIQGTTTAPKLSGTLGFNDLSTVLGLTGVRYTIPNDEIKITNQAIEFGNLNLVDGSGNEATLGGSVTYTDFTNLGLNLNFKTNRFQLLNTESQGDELYYGKLFVSADVNIRGTSTAPRIQVQATTLDSSQLFVQPLTARQAIAGQEDYIIFANPATFAAEDTTRSLDAAYQLNRASLDLTLNLEVTPETELQVIVDPATGDKLVVRGNANLSVSMKPQQELSITGNYQISSGSYSLNYQGFLKREFAIRTGSRLDFVGDPLDTRFDISASYTTRTPTYELIRNQVTTLTPEQERQAKERSPVSVVLSMKGDLEEPVITFDIQLGEEEADPVTSVEAQAIARLRDNPTELNTQVFSLLLFNSFLAQQSGGNLADAGTSVYLSSVSSLLSNQLNKLADQLVKGVDIEIGVESYQSQYDFQNSGSTITELNLGVNKQLFNDRLSVQVGGNVNVNSENSLLVQGANFSSIAGDFVLEYRLTENGNYRLRVFRRENVDVLNNTSIPQTGVGITFKRSFGQKGVMDKSEKNNKSKKGKSKKSKNMNNKDAVLPENEPKINQEKQ